VRERSQVRTLLLAFPRGHTSSIIEWRRNGESVSRANRLSACLRCLFFTCASLGTDTKLTAISEARIQLPKQSKERIPALDGLRGMAILLVLLYHFVSSPRIQPPLFHRMFAIGWSGVDLFFVLSGFLIGGILLDVRESPNYFRTFYGRRFYRIVPLYYVWISAYFLVSSIWSSRIAWRSIPIYLLFLQNYTKSDRAVLAMACLGALWSLAVEEQFYLIVPTVVRFLSPPRLLLMLSCAIIFAPIFRILLYTYLPNHPAAPYMLTPCRVDALAMGVLLAYGWRNERWKAAFYRYQTLIFGTCSLLLGGFLYLAIWRPFQYSLTMYSWGYFVVDVLFASLLAIAIMMPGSPWAAVCRLPFLTELGRVSYCLYVIHMAMNLVCHKLFFHRIPRFESWSTALVSAFAAVLSYGLAVLSWKFFEHPLLSRGHALKY
jgi:peptidoglycan/LPS O-acetylase OafA/YrhL